MPEEKAIRVEVIELTEQQREGLTVGREIPGWGEPPADTASWFDPAVREAMLRRPEAMADLLIHCWAILATWENDYTPRATRHHLNTIYELIIPFIEESPLNG